MRIALVVEYLHARGGTQRQALELARHFSQAGHDVTVFTGLIRRADCFPHLNKDLNIAAIREEKENMAGKPIRNVNPFLAPIRKNAGKLYRRMGLNYVSDFRIMTKATKRLCELIAKHHAKKQFDIVNPHDYGPAAWAASTISEWANIPSVWQCNDPLLRWDDNSKMPANAMRKWLITRDRHRVSGTAVITVLDHVVAQTVRERYQKKTIVVRSGVEFERFAKLPDRETVRKSFGLPPENPVILVLTLLTSPHRRVEDVVAAHARGPENAWLLLVATETGNIAYARKTDDAVNASPAKHRIIRIKRSLKNEDELLSLFAASDLFVFPNIRQTWGLAVCEAAAAGLPVLVSDGAGSHEIFSDGHDGFIYRGGDVGDLTGKLRRILDDKSLRRHVAENGKKMIQNGLSWRKYADQMEAVFQGQLL